MSLSFKELSARANISKKHKVPNLTSFALWRKFKGDSPESLARFKHFSQRIPTNVLNSMVNVSDGIVVFNKNDLAELIWSYYYDIDDLLLAESSNIYDPAFHSFIVKTGFYTDHKSQARLRDDWGYLFPIVLAKWIKQVELNYRPSTKGAKKNCGTLSTFFNKSFPRILVMSYIDYCRTVHKERAGTTPAADRFNFVDVPVEDLPSLSNPTIMDNELAYHILSISRPASLYGV